MFILKKIWDVLPTEKYAGGSSTKGDHDQTVTEGETSDDPIETKEIARIEGVITMYDASLKEGTIDRMYKFKADQSKYLTLRRNMVVTFVPKEDPGSADILAEDIQPLDIAKQKLLDEQRRHRVINCKVIKSDPDFVEVGLDENDPERFRIPVDLLPKGVLEGDWLHVELTLDESGGGSRAKVDLVDWKDKIELVGKVTKSDGFFCINGTIYFTQDVVDNQRDISIGKFVKVIAVASDQEIKMNRNRRDGAKEGPLFRQRALKISHIDPVQRTVERTVTVDEDWDDDSCGTQVNKLNAAIETLISNKDGIEVTPRRYVMFESVVIGSTVSQTVMVNNLRTAPVVLKNVEMLNMQDVCEFQFEYSSEKGEDGIVLIPRIPLIVTIRCTARQLGRTRALCTFQFTPDHEPIARWLVVTSVSEDELLMKRLTHSNSQDGHWRKFQDNRESYAESMFEENKKDVIPAPKLVRQAFFIPNQIRSNSVTKDVRDIFKTACESEEAAEVKFKKLYPINFEHLGPENYVKRFQLSLWFEELENEVERRKYDMHDVEMCPVGENLVVSVPYLREMIPPVLQGDQVKCFDGSISDKPFNGNIERIEYSELEQPKIHLRFHESFHLNYRGSPVQSLQFCLGRNTYKRQHFAVIQAMDYLTSTWLFPTFESITYKPQRIQFLEVPDSVEPQNFALSAMPREPREARDKVASAKVASERPLREDHRAVSLKRPFESNVQIPSALNKFKLKWFNVNLNKEQRDAVRQILKSVARPLPYVIFGPPGTGKTVTVVEAIKQIYFMEPTSRILVTVPSNAGADLIAEHLAVTGLFRPGDFVRLNGFMRSEVGMPETIVEFCVDGTYLDSVAKHRLIICTVSTAGQFFQLNLNTGHFSHVFVDEAGYCTEPEAMIPCVLAAVDKQAVVVLAGDPQQLGPVLMNDMAVNDILKTSFLERLMETEIYGRNEKLFPENKYNPALLTKLVRSYRAHPVLLKVPSELFYNDELVACARGEAYEFCTEKANNFLVKPGVPLIFHGIKGRCDQDRDSPSWFNLTEVSQVIDYVRKLRNYGISAEDVGIITPYRKQVEKIRAGLECRLLDSAIPKVASVQEFQGGERKVIIISTVRSDYEDVLQQKISRFDFLYSRKLFNVSITRAKALMIIIGNPYVLNLNKYWNRLLEYSVDMDAYVGCDLPPQLNKRLRSGIDDLNNSLPQLAQADDEEDFDPDFGEGEDSYGRA